MRRKMFSISGLWKGKKQRRKKNNIRINNPCKILWEQQKNKKIKVKEKLFPFSFQRGRIFFFFRFSVEGQSIFHFSIFFLISFLYKTTTTKKSKEPSLVIFMNWSEDFSAVENGEQKNKKNSVKSDSTFSRVFITTTKRI